MTETEDKKSSSESKNSNEDNVEVTKLTDGDIRYREKYKVTKSELEAAKAQSEADKSRLAEQLSAKDKHLKMIEEKYIDTELTRQATEAGIKDVEFLKLADKTQIKLVDGKVEGIDKVITELKTRKPDWFGSDKKSSTSSGASFSREATKSGGVQHKDAWSMTPAEFSKSKADLTRGRYR